MLSRHPADSSEAMNRTSHRQRRVTWALVALGLLAATGRASGQSVAWTQRYDGPPADASALVGGPDLQRSRHALALDGAGNLYAAGRASKGFDYVALLVKYDNAGQALWAVTYASVAAGSDLAYAVTADAAGNAYVVGRGWNGASWDALLLKYDPAGTLLWSRRWDGPRHSTDEAFGVALDAAGNIYLGGSSRHAFDAQSRDDALLLKYDAAGTLLWSAVYDGPGHHDDQPWDFALDASGNAHLSGRTWNGVNWDALVLKFDATGARQWAVTRDGSLHQDDAAHALALGPAGDVYITGSIGEVVIRTPFSARFNAAGQQQWLTTEPPSGATGLPGRAIAVDAAGRVFMAGESSFLSLNLVRYDPSGVVQWRASLGGIDSSAGYDVIPDNAGGAWVTGNKRLPASPSIRYQAVTLKYDGAGQQQWVDFYDASANGSGTTRAFTLERDAAGNIFAGGFTDGLSDFVVLKYDAAGTRLFVRAEPPLSVSSEAPAVEPVALDAAGNSFLAGTRSSSSGTDGVLLKYDAAGVRQWEAIYTPPAGTQEFTAVGVATDATGSVYVAFGSLSGRVLRKYSSAGALLWEAQDPGGGTAAAAALAVAPDGSAYVAGTVAYARVRLLKYDPAGALVWAAEYDGPEAGDVAERLALDAAGNVIVGGFAYNPPPVPGDLYNLDYLAVKFSPAGVVQWAVTYETLPGFRDVPKALGVDAQGNVYLTGYSWRGSPNDYDWLTLKYDAAGAFQWAAAYNGPDSNDDVPVAMAVSPEGDVYVTGALWRDFALSAARWAIVRYDSVGNQRFAFERDGSSTIAWGAAAVVDAWGEVWFAGQRSTGGVVLARYDHDLFQLLWEQPLGSVMPGLGGGRLKLGPQNQVFYAAGVSGVLSADLALVKLADSTPPAPPTSLLSPSHTPGAWSRERVLALRWSGALDPGGLGVLGYSRIVDQSPATLPDTAIDQPHAADPQAFDTPPLADGGGYHAHLRTCDRAGNCTAGALHLGPFLIDATPPGSVSGLGSTSHVPGVPSGDTTIDIVWTAAAADATSGLDGYAVALTGSATPACDQSKDLEESAFGFTSAPQPDGNRWVHVCAVDVAGNWGAVQTAGPYRIATQADLAVSQSAPAEAAPRRRLAYSVSVTNNGGFDATGVTLVDTLPAGVTFVSVVPGAPTCAHASGQITCAFGNLPFLGSAGAAIEVELPAALGTLVNHAQVSGTLPDGVPGNNQSDAQTQVLVRKGDLDNDVNTDILLRHTSLPRHVLWRMQGTTRLDGLTLADAAALEWQLSAVDDFDGDLRNDLAFWNAATGAVEFWLMDGAQRLETRPLTGADPLPPVWQLTASADFNHDGQADLVWRNTQTQAVLVWTLGGTVKIGEITPTPAQAQHANWQLVAALDFDGDANTDFLWYNRTTGKIVQWLMDASVVRTLGRFTTPDSAGNANWRVVAAGEYGPGLGGVPRSNDILWRNETSGNLVVWHMAPDGTRTSGVFTTPSAPSAPLSWTVAGPK